MAFIKLFCLLLAIVYGFGNVARVIRGLKVSSAQMWLMGIGVVGFVAIQFNLLG